MAAADRVKRKLLRGAVEDNLATINGQGTWALRRRRKTLQAWVRRTLLLAAPLVLLSLLALGGVVAGAGPGWWLSAFYERSTGESGPPISGGTRVGPDATAVAGAAEARFPHPQRLDPRALSLPVRRIVLDPGHGGTDFGTIGPAKLVEKELALDVVRRLRPLLEGQAFQVIQTRDGDIAVPLDRRAQLANAAGGDLFISVHVNWIPNRTARGVETYYLGPTDDPYLTELAASENSNSGYSLTDFRRLLDGIYVDMRHEESRALASSVQDRLFRSLATSNPALRDRGVKRAPFIVLVATEMPAVLVEVSCLSNDEEASLLATPAYREQIARALFAGILTFCKGHGSQPERTPTS
jgi:N-acetylmuramoyl-L-alanine amidase